MADALIDTSALIAHFRRRIHLGNTLSNYRRLYVSAITVYELEYGAGVSGAFLTGKSFWSFSRCTYRSGWKKHDGRRPFRQRWLRKIDTLENGMS